MSSSAALLKERAEAGDAKAMLEYGVQLLQETPCEGVAWLRKCVDASDAERPLQATACYALGYAYEAGQGVEANDAESRRWIAEAARRGNAQAKELTRRRRREFRRKRGLDVALVVCLLLFVCVAKTLFELCYVLYHRETFKEEVSGADPGTPAYQWRDEVIAEREDLVRKAKSLLQLTEATAQPLSNSFEHTRGVVAHFTRPAVDDPRAFLAPELSWIRNGFLEKVLDPQCNAFVFNVLVVPSGRWANRTHGVDFHVDQTLIQSTTQREQTAFTVSVGYVHVPRHIDGGYLEVAGRRHQPREGSVLVFRGDQNHAVAAFCAYHNHTTPRPREPCALDDANPAFQRVSFVLEQYKLPPHKLRRSPYFVLAPTKLEEELFPILSAFPLGPTLVDLFLHLRKRLFFPYKRRLLRASQSEAVGDEPRDFAPSSPSGGSSIGDHADVSPL